MGYTVPWLIHSARRPHGGSPRRRGTGRFEVTTLLVKPSSPSPRYPVSTSDRVLRLRRSRTRGRLRRLGSRWLGRAAAPHDKGSREIELGMNRLGKEGLHPGFVLEARSMGRYNGIREARQDPSRQSRTSEERGGCLTIRARMVATRSRMVHAPAATTSGP